MRHLQQARGALLPRLQLHGPERAGAAGRGAGRPPQARAGRRQRRQQRAQRARARRVAARRVRCRFGEQREQARVQVLPAAGPLRQLRGGGRLGRAASELTGQHVPDAPGTRVRRIAARRRAAAASAASRRERRAVSGITETGAMRAAAGRMAHRRSQRQPRTGMGPASSRGRPAHRAAAGATRSSAASSSSAAARSPRASASRGDPAPPAPAPAPAPRHSASSAATPWS
jgi:hypothetical protein